MSEEANSQGEDKILSSGFSRRKFIRLAAAAAAIIPASSALLAACGDSTATPATANTTAAAGATTVSTSATTAAAATSTTAAAASTGKIGGNLVVGVRVLPPTLDPIVLGANITVAPTMYFAGAVFDTLTLMDGPKVVPGLAVSWKQIDSLNWEFKLRKGVKFHNGEDFDSAAVKFSMDTYFAQKAFFQRLITVESYAAPDAETFTIKTKVPNSVLHNRLSNMAIVPPRYYAQKGADGFNAAPIGSGPFQFVSFERDKQVVIKRNDGHWRVTPKLDTVTYKVIPDIAAQVQALKAGDVDMIQLSTRDQYDQLKSQGLKVYNTIAAATVALTFKNIKETGPITDKRVRQALTYAINKPEMIKAIFGDLTQAATQLPTPVSTGYDPAIAQAPYDVDKAKALLKEAGIKDGDLSFSIVYSAGSVGRTEIVDALSQYWGKIGVQIKGEPQDIVLFVQKGTANDWPPITLVSQDHVPDSDGVQVVSGFTTQSGGAQRWNNPDGEKLILQVLAATDQDKQVALIKQMDQLLRDDFAYIPLYYGPDLFASSTKVEGFVPSSNRYLRVETISKA